MCLIALYTLNYYEEYYEDKCLVFLHTLSTSQEYIPPILHIY